MLNDSLTCTQVGTQVGTATAGGPSVVANQPRGDARAQVCQVCVEGAHGRCVGVLTPLEQPEPLANL